MRVLFLLDRLNLGGAERHTLNLSRALAARGHDVMVVVLFSGGSTSFPLEDFPTRPVLLQGRTLVSLPLIDRLAAEFHAFRPDVIFAINQSALVAATMARFRGAPISHLACRFSTTLIPTAAGKLKLPLFKWCTARADTLIFVSLLQRAYWEGRGMTARHVVAIQNGISTTRFHPPADSDRAAMRARHGLADGDVALALVGRLAPEKNHAWLLRILAAMRAEQPGDSARLRLLLIGEGPLLDDLTAQVAALGLGDRVLFLGGARDILPLLSMADVGILVSNAIETFSNAALELMACGLPMILTEIGGASEIVTEGEQGYLIPVNDDASLRRALQQVRDPDLRARLGAAARQRVMAQFTDVHMVDRYEALILGSAQARGA